MELSDEFADYMEREFAKHLHPNSNNSAKRLLHAYLKKCYDCFLTEQKFKELAKNCQKS